MHVIGTAGHVDHGKSTLVERLTGIDPDRFEEEKRRGLTIDLGFAWMTTPVGREIGIIDVPGHERFIKNMLAGAGGISMVLFVVDANEGWMPQSSEHLGIVNLLGIDTGVVALTKVDLADAETVELAEAEVQEKLAGTSLEGARVVPVSAVTGSGLDELVEALDLALDAAPQPMHASRPRLWVDRSFTIAGAGTVLTGTLMGGDLRTGETVEVVPSQQQARIRTIQSHKKKVESIGPGNRVAINLVGLDTQEVGRGDAIVSPDGWRSTDRFDAIVETLPTSLSGSRRKLTNRGAFLLHAGTAESAARISLLDRRSITPGESGYVRVWLGRSLPLVRGDRFVLRDAGRAVTLGGGRVLDPGPSSRKVRNQDRLLEMLRRLEAAASEDALRAIVRFERKTPVDQALIRAGLSSIPQDIPRLGSMLVSDETLDELTQGALRIVGRWHLGHPLDRGIPREDLRGELGLPADEFDDLLQTMDELQDEKGRVRLSSFEVELDPEQARRAEELKKRIEAGGFAPPLRDELQVPSDLLRSLVESGELVEIGDFYLTSAQTRSASQKVRAHIEKVGPVSVAQVRDLLGTSRKYAVPLCEWLDDSGATRRQGDLRVLGPND